MFFAKRFDAAFKTNLTKPVVGPLKLKADEPMIARATMSNPAAARDAITRHAAPCRRKRMQTSISAITPQRIKP